MMVAGVVTAAAALVSANLIYSRFRKSKVEETTK
jgi:hypothetical protein